MAEDQKCFLAVKILQKFPVKCQQEWREINRNNWGFPWFIEFPQIYYPIADCSVSTLLWWEWARVWEPRGWGSETSQPKIATGSWITPRYITMEMLMGCRGPVVLLLTLQSWLCCKNHLLNSQKKKVDLKSQNAFLSITWPPREIFIRISHMISLSKGMFG